MVDHLQSRVTPWRQYASDVKVRGTLSKMDVTQATGWTRPARPNGTMRRITGQQIIQSPDRYLQWSQPSYHNVALYPTSDFDSFIRH